MASDELIRSSATSLVLRLAKGELTPLDLLDALEPRIAAVDPLVNALPTLCFDRARDHAKALMKKLEADIKAVSLDPAIQNKLAGAGLDTFYKTPEQTLSLLSSDIDFYKKMSKIANIKQE